MPIVLLLIICATLTCNACLQRATVAFDPQNPAHPTVKSGEDSNCLACGSDTRQSAPSK